MSCDTAKENVSVVDSSVTDSKHEMGNSDDPESSNYKVKEDALAEGRYYCHWVENSNANVKNKLYNTRYFIIKSLSHLNIQLSVQKGIWATQVMNEPILEEAFHNSGKVILIFSVNMSGFFQGYAQMMSSVGWRRDNVWSQGNGGNNPWGRSFKVKWLQLCDLPFQKTLHLKNPLNDFKPVKISRDCQELPQDIGKALCELLDGQNDMDGGLKRDDFACKRPSMDPSSSGSLREGYSVVPAHVRWARTPELFPSMLYPYHHESSQFQLEHQKLSGLLKISRSSKNYNKVQVEPDGSSQLAVWSSSDDRSTCTSSITEDDFLEMSYEEYLEVHTRSHKQLCHLAALPTDSSKELSTNREHDNLLLGRRPRKRTHNLS